MATLENRVPLTIWPVLSMIALLMCPMWVTRRAAWA